MRKGFLLCVALIALVIVLIEMEQRSVWDKPAVTIQTPKAGGAGAGSAAAGAGVGNAEAAEATTTVELTKDQTYKGSLVLVNKDHAIHADDRPDDIVKLTEHRSLMDGYALLDNSIRLSAGVAKSFGKLVEAAKKDGITHLMISSGYRSNQEQSELYEQKGADYALPPGSSEHNLGLSLDLGSTLRAIDQAPEGAWLKKNAWSYGFVLRYPKDKTKVTGIQYEPWHFRYVGLPHSLIMKEKNLTLEEYLAYVKEKKELIAEAGGKRYDIRYIPVTDRATVQVPAHRSYELSGDNDGGVIVTIAL